MNNGLEIRWEGRLLAEIHLIVPSNFKEFKEKNLTWLKFLTIHQPLVSIIKLIASRESTDDV